MPYLPAPQRLDGPADVVDVDSYDLETGLPVSQPDSHDRVQPSSLGNHYSAFVGIDRISQAHTLSLNEYRPIPRTVAGLAYPLAKTVMLGVGFSLLLPVFDLCILRDTHLVFPIIASVLLLDLIKPQAVLRLLGNSIATNLIGPYPTYLALNCNPMQKKLSLLLAIAITSYKLSGAKNADETWHSDSTLGLLLESSTGLVEFTSAMNSTLSFQLFWLTSVWNKVGQLFAGHNQEIQSSEESSRIIQEMRDAKPLTEALLQWRCILPSVNQNLLNNGTWQTYNIHIGGPVFSSFLNKLFDGFPESEARSTALNGRNGFANKRLLPVLLAMQSSPDFAQRMFAIADAGLGACTDRPPLTYIDMELETGLHEVLKPSTQGSTDSLARSVLRLELQKFRKHLALNLLVKGIRESNSLRTDFAAVAQVLGPAEDIEAMMLAYEQIQSRHPHFFPALPYRKYGTEIDLNLLRNLSMSVERQLLDLDANLTQQSIVDHLLASDSWREVLRQLTGKDLSQLKAQHLKKIDLQLERLTDRAMNELISEEVYAQKVLDLYQMRQLGLANLYGSAAHRNLTEQYLKQLSC